MPPRRKLFDQVTEPLDEEGEGVAICLLVGTVVRRHSCGMVVFGMLERKLLINDSSKKVSFL